MTLIKQFMNLKELISQGWQSLLRDRMRSTLTMLGIVWGLASVVLLLAYGQGLGGCVLHAFMNMGNNVIVMWPGQTSMQAGGQRAGKKVTYDINLENLFRLQRFFMASMRRPRLVGLSQA